MTTGVHPHMTCCCDVAVDSDFVMLVHEVHLYIFAHTKPVFPLMELFLYLAF